MNKKFFSAVLMGALLLGGTFVSCQDYDDDIENLQNQIDKLASSSDLSAQVSSLEGKISAAQSAAEAKAAAANTVAEAAKNAAGTAQSAADAAKTAADKVAADLTAANTDLAGKVAAAQTAAEAKAAELVDAAKAAANDEIAKAVAAAQAAQETADAAKADAKAAADALATAKAELAAAAEDDKTEAKAGVTEAKQAAAVAKAAADSAQVTADKAKEAAEALALKLAETDANVAKALADAKAANDALAELQSKVAANEEAIALAQEAADKAKALAEKAADKAEVEEALNAIKEEAEAQAAKVTALEAAVEAINAALKNKLEEGDLAGLQSQIDELRKDVKLLTDADPIEVVSVNAPAGLVKVYFEHAKWNPSTKDVNVKLLEELKNEYKDAPWIDFTKNQLVKQGGHLPVIVNPADIKLNDKYDFSLQDIYGKDVEIEVSNPVSGLLNAEVATIEDKNGDNVVVGIQTKAVDTNASVWTLSIAPAIDKKTKQYKFVNTLASLAVETPKGEVIRTPYSYQVVSAQAANVEIATSGTATYAPSIDLTKKGTDSVVPVKIENLYEHYQIIELTSNYEKRKYDLDIVNNETLTIGNMPSDVTSITVHLRVVALGLNGSVAEEKEFTLTISQMVEANTNLDTQDLELNGKKQAVKWSIEDLGDLDAVQMDNIFQDGKYKFIVQLNDEDGKPTSNTVYNDAPIFWNGNTETTYSSATHKWDKGEPTDFGFVVNASEAVKAGLARVFAPAEYTVSFESKDGENVVFSAPTTLTTTVPALTDKMIRIAEGFKEGENTMRLIGKVGTDYAFDATNKEVTAGTITFKMVDALVLNNVVVDSIYDNVYNPDITATPHKANFNFVEKTAAGAYNVKVNVWRDYDYSYTWWSAPKWNQVEEVRPMTAVLTLWGNDSIKANWDFNTVVKSPIYKADGKVLEKSAFTTKYGGDAIKVKEQITKGTYAAGPKAGQTYSLWNTKDGSDAVTEGKDTTYLDVNDYNKPQTISNLTDPSSTKYIKGTNGKVIVVDDLKYIIPFGWQSTSYGYVEETHSVQLTEAMYNAGIETMNKYYYQDTIDGKVKPMKVLVWTETVEGKPVYKYDDTTHKIYHQRGYDSDAAADRFIFEVDGEMMYSTNGSDTISWDNYTGPDAYDGKTVKEGWSLVNKDEAHLALLKSDPSTATQAELYALTIDFCKEIMTKIAFNQKTLTVITDRKAADAVAASGLAAELACEPYLAYGDANEDVMYLTIDNAKLTIKAQPTSITEAPESVKRTLYLVVKDKWGKTMKCPIEVTVNTK